jgi:hypothetical protein
MDKIVIIEQVIGAFLGFVLALLGAWLTTFIVKRIKIHNLKKRAYLELAEVYYSKKYEKNQYTLLYYDHPIWDSIISTGVLLEIGDNAFLQSLVSIYARLEILKELEQKMVSENEEQNPSSDILKKRKKLATDIQNSEYFKYINEIVSKLNKMENIARGIYETNPR